MLGSMFRCDLATSLGEKDHRKPAKMWLDDRPPGWLASQAMYLQKRVVDEQLKLDSNSTMAS